MSKKSLVLYDIAGKKINVGDNVYYSRKRPMAAGGQLVKGVVERIIEDKENYWHSWASKYTVVIKLDKGGIGKARSSKDQILVIPKDN